MTSVEKRVSAEAEYYTACILKMRVDTTGYRGGDTGHGAFTTITLHNVGSFDLRPTVSNGGDTLTLTVGGDYEQSSLLAALELVCVAMRKAGVHPDSPNKQVISEIEEIVTKPDQEQAKALEQLAKRLGGA